MVNPNLHSGHLRLRWNADERHCRRSAHIGGITASRRRVRLAVVADVNEGVHPGSAVYLVLHRVLVGRHWIIGCGIPCGKGWRHSQGHCLPRGENAGNSQQQGNQQERDLKPSRNS